MDRTLRLALASLIFNIMFAIYYLIVGLIETSWWMLNLWLYYLILSIVRFVVICSKSKECISRFTGWMLIVLAISLMGMVMLSITKDRGHHFHMIIMIGIATYTFAKITIATINLFKSRRSNSVTLITLRNISFADAFVSIFALQRSMLVTFEGMTEMEIVTMNTILGSVICVIVFLLGINLLKKKKI